MGAAGDVAEGVPEAILPKTRGDVAGGLCDFWCTGCFPMHNSRREAITQLLMEFLQWLQRMLIRLLTGKLKLKTSSHQHLLRTS